MLYIALHSKIKRHEETNLHQMRNQSANMKLFANSVLLINSQLDVPNFDFKNREKKMRSFFNRNMFKYPSLLVECFKHLNPNNVSNYAWYGSYAP